ncbi:MAG: substrate-binding domain-containing protein [Clostridiales bacterium]|nr:substrate-binding domain-containing protein [Clostridiales bacterium]
MLKASKEQSLAKQFADFLSSPEASAVFEKYGFKTRSSTASFEF